MLEVIIYGMRLINIEYEIYVAFYSCKDKTACRKYFIQILNYTQDLHYKVTHVSVRNQWEYTIYMIILYSHLVL